MTPPPADWVALFRVLDAYGTAGRMAELWWRDDDATQPTKALDRLRAISAATGIVPLIAVIPARATPELAALTDLVVCQHGWNHDNHAPLGQSKAELGAHRPLPVVMGELARGWLKIKSLFAAPLPILVPPHNRISKEAADLLGYDYTFGGKVIHGDKRGRTIGFPTANLAPDTPDKMLPADGVYAIRARLTEGFGETIFAGMMNIGFRPTVDGQQHLPEPLIIVRLGVTQPENFRSREAGHGRIRDHAHQRVVPAGQPRDLGTFGHRALIVP